MMIRLIWSTIHPIPDAESRERLNKMRKSKILTDMALYSQEKVHPCHKIIVANASPFVKELIALEPDRAKMPMIMVDDDVPKNVEILLNCMYLGLHPIDSQNVEGVLTLADKLFVNVIVEGCKVSEKLTSEKAIVQPNSSKESKMVNNRIGNTMTTSHEVNSKEKRKQVLKSIQSNLTLDKISKKNVESKDTEKNQAKQVLLPKKCREIGNSAISDSVGGSRKPKENNVEFNSTGSTFAKLLKESDKCSKRITKVIESVAAIEASTENKIPESKSNHEKSSNNAVQNLPIQPVNILQSLQTKNQQNVAILIHNDISSEDKIVMRGKKRKVNNECNEENSQSNENKLLGEGRRGTKVNKVKKIDNKGEEPTNEKLKPKKAKRTKKLSLKDSKSPNDPQNGIKASDSNDPVVLSQAIFTSQKTYQVVGEGSSSVSSNVAKKVSKVNKRGRKCREDKASVGIITKKKRKSKYKKQKPRNSEDEEKSKPKRKKKPKEDKITLQSVPSEDEDFRYRPFNTAEPSNTEQLKEIPKSQQEQAKEIEKGIQLKQVNLEPKAKRKRVSSDFIQPQSFKKKSSEDHTIQKEGANGIVEEGGRRPKRKAFINASERVKIWMKENNNSHQVSTLNLY